MYQTCLFCSQSLGRNQVLEDLPIGRRVAFDGARGRLWVVCRTCERWNLVPFDHRLEAIDAAEREFRATRLRYSTGEIGLARVSEGLELVRIGAPARPEFAAWRYGDQFGRRRRRSMLLTSAVAVGAVGVTVGSLTLGLGLTYLHSLGNMWLQHHYASKVIGRLVDAEGESVVVQQTSISRDARVRRGEGGSWELVVPVRRPGPDGRVSWRSRQETITLHGADALDGLQRLLPGLNALGGSPRVIESAVRLAEAHDVPGLVEQAMQGRTFLHLARLTASHRLAAEMVSQEESERVAMAGELALLQREWRRAEELAAIADSLALPEPSVRD